MIVHLMCIVLLVLAAEASKILGIFMTPSYSHQRVYQPIWKELSLRGHDVTVYTPNPLKDPTLTNLTEIDMSFSYEVWKNYSSGNFKQQSKLEEAAHLLKTFSAVFEIQMASSQMQELLSKKNKEKYDLLLIEFVYPSMYPFKDVFGCPMVGITSLSLTGGAYAALGMMKHPVLDPDFLLPFSTVTTFREKVISTLFYGLTKLNLALKLGPELNTEARKYFGPNTRDVMEISKEVSLVLGNYNYALHNVRPTVPQLIEISGLHLTPEKPLPNDLKQILDKSDEGVVYFSLGSNVRSSQLPDDKLKAILGAFSEVPYKILFKFEKNGLTNISKLSTNVEIREWIPQQDVLRHPNIKLFVTQGGLQSIDEALNSNVPMLIIPFFGDQYFNAHKLVSTGAALSMDFNNFTKEELVEKINKIIKDPGFKKTATRLGSIAFDQQVPPLEKAVWWIEYALRHNGAEHLKYKGVNMPFYQFYLLDVFCFLGLVTALTFYFVYQICKKLITGYKFVQRSWKSSDALKKSQ